MPHRPNGRLCPIRNAQFVKNMTYMRLYRAGADGKRVSDGTIIQTRDDQLENRRLLLRQLFGGQFGRFGGGMGNG